MKVSLEWISDYIDIPPGVSPADLAHELTLKTVEVEEVHKVDDDIVLEIDNKSLTNRPDLWGHYGIARELAAIYSLPLRPLPAASRPPVTEGLVGDIDPLLCARFTAVEFTAADVPPVPSWLTERLARIGEGSVNPLVDLSNYVMFAVGQPTHVYDTEAVTLPLSVANAGDGVEVDLLTGQSARLRDSTPVIRDANGIVGIAGVLGGADSGVSATSTRFVLEAATFAPREVRRSSQRLGLRTQASSRYEKGLDTQRVDVAIDLFLHLLGAVIPAATVIAAQDVINDPTESAEILVSREFLDRRIGERLPDGEVLGTLGALGFTTAADEESLRLTVPTWRSTGDVSLPHDIVEEIARIHGYDRLPVVRPSAVLRPVEQLNRRPLDRVVREQLAGRAGLHEVVTYPWTYDRLLAATGWLKDDTVRFEGAPAPDRDSLRPSLVPNLLDAIALNLKHTQSFGIFEVGVVFSAEAPAPYRGRYETMPVQSTRLGLALVGTDGPALFRQAKGVLEMMRRHSQITDLVVEGETDTPWADASARIALRSNGKQVGTLALLTPRARRLAGLGSEQIALAEVDLGALSAYDSRENRFAPIPELPEADFDLSVVVADEVTWAEIDAVVRAAHMLVHAVSYVDEYRGTWVPDAHRSLTLRVTLRPTDSTLTAEVIAEAREAALDALNRQLAARLR